jgi:membrane fusion protein (multidrug efflux system)
MTKGRGLVLFFVLVVAGCRGGRSEEDGVSSSGDGRHGAGHLAESRAPVAVLPAFIGPISSYYETTATLEVDKDAEVLARVEGIVHSIPVEEGHEVKEGKSLLRIDNGEYRLRLEEAESNTRNLESKHGRMREIAKDLISVEDLESIKNELDSARVAEGLARLNLSYTAVKAPFNGRIVRRYVDEGQNVSVGTALFSLADFNPLLARVHVPSKAFRAIKVEQQVELVVDSTQERLRGHIVLVSPTIDPKTGTIKVTVEISEYPDDTRPGDFAKVQIVTDCHPASILVPRNAVVSEESDQVVFVVADNMADRRIVEVGFTDENHAEILSGVNPGERVVIKGQRSLEHGAPLKVLEDDPPKTPSLDVESLGS